MQRIPGALVCVVYEQSKEMLNFSLRILGEWQVT